MFARNKTNNFTDLVSINFEKDTKIDESIDPYDSFWLKCLTVIVIFVEMIIYLLLKVDGGWGEWYAWSECSVACGKGEIRRLRICDNPAPQQGGKCRGTNSETETCNGPSCPGKLIRLQTV